jgi:hypothetical protein
MVLGSETPSVPIWWEIEARTPARTVGYTRHTGIRHLGVDPPIPN